MSGGTGMRRNADVIVIGAGIAGLATTLTLAKAGIEVLILEREPGVGGRLKSAFVGGFPCNIGAQWVSPGVQPLVDPYLGRFELQTIGNMGFTWEGELVKVEGEDLLASLPFPREAKDDFLEASRKMAADAELLYKGRCWDEVYDLEHDDLWKELEGQTIADYLSTYHPYVTDLWGTRVKGGFGGGPDEVSAYFLVAWYRGSPWFPMSLVKGGNHLLADAMLDDCEKAGARLQSEKEVVEVVQDGDGVKVTCAGGEEYRSQFAVITTPADTTCSVVNGLSVEKRSALDAVEYVTLTQLALQVQNLPETDELAGVLFIGGETAAYVCQTGAVAGYPTTGNVISVSITDQGKKDITDREALAAIGNDLRLVNPGFDHERDILEYVIKRWKIGEVHMRPGFLSTYGETLKQAEGNIYFAGDYASDFPVWGGAVWSGVRAARNIAQRYGTTVV